MPEQNKGRGVKIGVDPFCRVHHTHISKRGGCWSSRRGDQLPRAPRVEVSGSGFIQGNLPSLPPGSINWYHICLGRIEHFTGCHRNSSQTPNSHSSVSTISRRRRMIGASQIRYNQFWGQLECVRGPRMSIPATLNQFNV